jgi:ERCC4-related helicase
LAAEEKELLTDLRQFAANAVTRADSKARTLVQWLKNALKPGGQWSDKRVILFTEYRATQKWLHELLAAEGLAGQERFLTHRRTTIIDREPGGRKPRVVAESHSGRGRSLTACSRIAI